MVVVAILVAVADAFRLLGVDSTGVEGEGGMVDITTTGGVDCGMTDTVDVAMCGRGCAGATVVRLILLLGGTVVCDDG